MMLKIPPCLPQNSPSVPSIFIDFAGSINTETVRSEKSAGSAETVPSLVLEIQQVILGYGM